MNSTEHPELYAKTASSSQLLMPPRIKLPEWADPRQRSYSLFSVDGALLSLLNVCKSSAIGGDVAQIIVIPFGNQTSRCSLLPEEQPNLDSVNNDLRFVRGIRNAPSTSSWVLHSNGSSLCLSTCMHAIQMASVPLHAPYATDQTLRTSGGLDSITGHQNWTSENLDPFQLLLASRAGRICSSISEAPSLSKRICSNCA
ncbi:hypothetical protein PoB_004666400 [Plakobranchus ocellatus]|uniref:Uncharacterized protein n=1 Tax=Plakobranchus ocellatus TaxID=259542 RepID=A0AAV4BPC2_9GAST|nr:hypothetical protein PoB_004666400 [Plakobranchus ocellatus]